jgi:hypothetical protein
LKPSTHPLLLLARLLFAVFGAPSALAQQPAARATPPYSPGDRR